MSPVAAAENDPVDPVDEIRELAAQVHATEARLAEKLAEFLSDGRWNGGDWKSPVHWVSVNCGYAHAEASALVRVSEAVKVMPEVMSHALDGEVSLGVLAMAGRVATPAIDSELADIVTLATPNQVSRLLAKYRDLRPRPPTSEPDDGQYFWKSWYEDSGDWRGSMRTPAEIGALLDEAYAAATRAAEGERPDPAPDRNDGVEPWTTPRVPVTESLRCLADLALDAARGRRLTRPGGEPFTVTVLIDLTTLVSGELRADSICRFESGPDVTPDLVRRLAEEGSLELLWHRDGVPLKLGRRFRLANRHQRRALRFRDGGCAVPGCRQTRHVHVHHVEYWENGGATDLENEVMLCSYHHSLVHHHGWTIVTNGDQRFTFLDRFGREVGNPLVRHLRSDRRPPPGPPDRRRGPDAPAERRAMSGLARGEPLTSYALDVWVTALLNAASRDDHAIAA